MCVHVPARGLPLICALSVCCGVLCCGHVSLDAMNLLLPEHERESDELFDASVSVKQEPLLAAEAKDQLLQQPMDEEKEALGQDDDKDEEEPGVLLSLSQLPSAPGGPGRSRILALDKLTELGASEGPAGKEEEKEAAEDEESEWQSNWQSPAAAVHTSRHKPTSTADSSTPTCNHPTAAKEGASRARGGHRGRTAGGARPTSGGQSADGGGGAQTVASHTVEGQGEHQAAAARRWRQR